MIYTLMTFIVILIAIYIIQIRVSKKLRGDKEELQKKLNIAYTDIKSMKKNYENFKKVYDSLLKKNNALNKEYKKFKKTIGRR